MIKRTFTLSVLAVVLSGCLASMPGTTPSQPQPISAEHIEMVKTLNATELGKLADKGDQYAQYYLGNKYAQGSEVPQDINTAKKYWEQAATQGNANALYNLGMTFYSGQGSPKSFETALGYFQRSANAGNSIAALTAGSMFENGQGTPINIPAAAKLYQQAANEQPNAAYRLGLLYTLDTPDFPADYNQAVTLLQQAAMKGDRFAPRALSIVQNYPPEQAAELLKRMSTSI